VFFLYVYSAGGDSGSVAVALRGAPFRLKIKLLFFFCSFFKQQQNISFFFFSSLFFPTYIFGSHVVSGCVDLIIRPFGYVGSYPASPTCK
jgi:hypothetical protein